MVIGPLDGHTYCAQSAFTNLGDLVKAVRLFTASLHSQPMCSIDIFVNLKLVG